MLLTIYLEYHKSCFLSTWIKSNMINMIILLPTLTTAWILQLLVVMEIRAPFFYCWFTQVNSQQLYVLFKPPILFKDKEITTPFSDHKITMGDLFLLFWPISISQESIPTSACFKKYVTLQEMNLKVNRKNRAVAQVDGLSLLFQDTGIFTTDRAPVHFEVILRKMLQILLMYAGRRKVIDPDDRPGKWSTRKVVDYVMYACSNCFKAKCIEN